MGFFLSVMKDPHIAAAAGTDTSQMDALTTTLCNSIQALGRGFDVTADIRLLYCKGTPGSRLVQLDDGHSHGKDLVLFDGVVIPNVPDHVQCSSDTRATENVPVCTFHKVNFLAALLSISPCFCLLIINPFYYYFFIPCPISSLYLFSLFTSHLILESSLSGQYFISTFWSLLLLSFSCTYMFLSIFTAVVWILVFFGELEFLD